MEYTEQNRIEFLCQHTAHCALQLSSEKKTSDSIRKLSGNMVSLDLNTNSSFIQLVRDKAKTILQYKELVFDRHRNN